MTDEEIKDEVFKLQPVLQATWEQYESFEQFERVHALLVTFARTLASRARTEGLDEALDVVAAYSAQLVDSQARHEAYEVGGIACHSISERVRALQLRHWGVNELAQATGED